MTTDEIINRMGQIKFTYSRLTADVFSAEEVARDQEAMTEAIHAVQALEAIKQEMKGDCFTCNLLRYAPDEERCQRCWKDNKSCWAFRWDKEEQHGNG